jgi:hypothetical protein
MRKPGHRSSVLAALAFLFAAAPATAKPRVPVPDTAYDGGVISAETRGRGQTTASNRGTAASGSENPASLEQPDEGGSLYATTLVDTRSRLPDDTADNLDPLRGKTLQYLSVGADKGVLFYEPIARYHQTQVLDAASGITRDVELNANAIGFAGASKMKSGSFGLSIAYLWSSVNTVDMTGGSITAAESGNANGLRMNLGMRYPTGPAMWGLVVQNAPAFLWGSDFKRDQLPLKIRVGNTYRIAKGVLLSIDGERRFYHEGGNSEDFIYVGNESFVGKRLVVRAGAFGTSLNSARERTVTAGATITARNNTQLSYAWESFTLGDERIKRSIISITAPFVGTDE